MARWFYWGATTYQNGVLSGAAPAGWWGMEHPWLEDLQIRGTIGADFTATVTAVVQNHFQHLAEAGGDADGYARVAAGGEDDIGPEATE